MAPIKVYGSVFSGATMRVFAALYEKDVEFEFVPVDMRANEHKKEPLISINPFGQVPAFEDGDLKLFESRAITQYIAHRYADKGTPLVVLSSEMAIITLWMEVEGQKFEPAASKLIGEIVIKPMRGMTPDAAVVEEYENKLAGVLDVYDAHLAKSKYLGGDCFTLADLHHLSTIQYLMGTQVKKLFESRPHVCAWVADITARPAWKKVLDMRNKP